MFDGSFHSLGSFSDPAVPTQYPVHTAWQVEDINGQLWVTYASHKPGPYGGVVDVFDSDGHLLTPNHFAANAPGGPLENPWGLVQAPANFGAFSNDILIGNVEGAGNINAFDPVTGAFLGQLQHPDGTPIAIPGLWDLAFGAGSKNNGKTNQLFFSGGPNVLNPAGNGLFGMIHVPGTASTDVRVLLGLGQSNASLSSGNGSRGQTALLTAFAASVPAPEASTSASSQTGMVGALPRPSLSTQALDRAFLEWDGSLAPDAFGAGSAVS